MLRKKKYVFRCVMLCVLMGVMGCGDAKGEETREEKKEESQKLILWSYYETKAQQEGLDKLVEGFNESQETYQLTWEYVPMTEYMKNLCFSYSPEILPDLVLVDNPDTESLIKIGLLADISGQLAGHVPVEEYYEEVWKSVEYQGHCYGVPFCCNNTAIIYNKEMFQNQGIAIPNTWEEFQAAAKSLTAGEKEGCYGFAMSAVNGEQGAFQCMPWILATGADRENLADQRVKDAFVFLHTLLQERCMPNDCMNWSQNDVTRSFLLGNAAMIENGPWALPDIEESGIDFGIFEFPEYDTRGVILGGENLVAVEGKNLEGALAFINYYNQEEVMEDICQVTRNIPPKRKLAEAYGEKNPSYQVFVRQMEQGISRSSVKGWKNVCRGISYSLTQLFGSDCSVEELWQEYYTIVTGK